MFIFSIIGLSRDLRLRIMSLRIGVISVKHLVQTMRTRILIKKGFIEHIS